MLLQIVEGKKEVPPVKSSKKMNKVCILLSEFGGFCR